jgi:ATP-dependent Clp protease ATP-binding subunit ClpC
VARLVGAPPGYVGYGRAVSSPELDPPTARALVLLDELEGPRSDVFNYLLPGPGRRSADRRQRAVDFTSTVLIAATNVPGEPIGALPKPEFVNPDRQRSSASTI